MSDWSCVASLGLYKITPNPQVLLEVWTCDRGALLGSQTCPAGSLVQILNRPKWLPLVLASGLYLWKLNLLFERINQPDQRAMCGRKAMLNERKEKKINQRQCRNIGHTVANTRIPRIICFKCQCHRVVTGCVDEMLSTGSETLDELRFSERCWIGC